MRRPVKPAISGITKRAPELPPPQGVRPTPCHLRFGPGYSGLGYAPVRRTEMAQMATAVAFASASPRSLS
ncbi:hypothetical protein PC129_g11358 [Phytophthora cactorum]|uniref:Uncharacterized protein n=1 Tax=Phytophthora cactorum TaxID=29920 RepID=A0A8T1E6Z2_9STRA|nr:hypothetical protein Pcac1_g10622 [Phytophthora cactorum]KAG2949228.1 hypothetical protein PC117_g5443 [Phytophthora cactorum]KAG3038133.1 hypothetical protein PC119_g3088 [Phytophthora cactorum]KAG3134778.1 hypothetical protein C6341_g22008 [Phytophthora cactorum]KAG3217820.1 hypothetical protein PC129_g11358 [Phytophthora cactorum]